MQKGEASRPSSRMAFTERRAFVLFVDCFLGLPSASSAGLLFAESGALQGFRTVFSKEAFFK